MDIVDDKQRGREDCFVKIENWIELTFSGLAPGPDRLDPPRAASLGARAIDFLKSQEVSCFREIFLLQHNFILRFPSYKLF